MGRTRYWDVNLNVRISNADHDQLMRLLTEIREYNSDPTINRIDVVRAAITRGLAQLQNELRAARQADK